MATTLTTKSGGRFETNLLIPLSGHVVRNPLSFTKEGFLGGFFYQISPIFRCCYFSLPTNHSYEPWEDKR